MAASERREHPALSKHTSIVITAIANLYIRHQDTLDWSAAKGKAKAAAKRVTEWVVGSIVDLPPEDPKDPKIKIQNIEHIVAKFYDDRREFPERLKTLEGLKAVIASLLEVDKTEFRRFFETKHAIRTFLIAEFKRSEHGQTLLDYIEEQNRKIDALEREIKARTLGNEDSIIHQLRRELGDPGESYDARTIIHKLRIELANLGDSYSACKTVAEHTPLDAALASASEEDKMKKIVITMAHLPRFKVKVTPETSAHLRAVREDVPVVYQENWHDIFCHSYHLNLGITPIPGLIDMAYDMNIMTATSEMTLDEDHTVDNTIVQTPAWYKQEQITEAAPPAPSTVATAFSYAASAVGAAWCSFTNSIGASGRFSGGAATPPQDPPRPSR